MMDHFQYLRHITGAVSDRLHEEKMIGRRGGPVTRGNGEENQRQGNRDKQGDGDAEKRIKRPGRGARKKGKDDAEMGKHRNVKKRTRWWSGNTERRRRKINGSAVWFREGLRFRERDRFRGLIGESSCNGHRRPWLRPCGPGKDKRS